MPMEYLKFNCFDMSSQNNELFTISNSFLDLSQELSTIINSLDPQLKNYDSLQKAMNVTCNAVKDITDRITNAHKSLDHIIDIYYAAEKIVLQNSEELPESLDDQVTGAFSKQSTRAYGKHRIEKSSINNSNIILEDWLSELVYKSE